MILLRLVGMPRKSIGDVIQLKCDIIQVTVNINRGRGDTIHL